MGGLKQYNFFVVRILHQKILVDISTKENSPKNILLYRENFNALIFSLKLKINDWLIIIKERSPHELKKILTSTTLLTFAI